MVWICIDRSSASEDCHWGNIFEKIYVCHQSEVRRHGRSALSRTSQCEKTPFLDRHLTSGMLSYQPIPGSASISMVNSGIEGFVRAAALEMLRGMRVNVVSPVFVKETLEAMGMDSNGGMSAVKVALAYKESVEGKRNGETLNVIDFA